MLKQNIIDRQNGICACGCERPLYPDYLDHLNEFSRLDGKHGELPHTEENTEVWRWEDHRSRHDNDSIPPFPGLRAAYQNRVHYMKERRRAEKQLEDVMKASWITPETVDELQDHIDRLSELEGLWKSRMVDELGKIDHPMVEAMAGVRGIGDITIAFLLAEVNIHKASGPRSVCEFLGIGDPHGYWVTDGDGNRKYREGRNPGLGEKRAQLRQMSESQVKSRGPYYLKYKTSKWKHLWRGESKGSAHNMALRETAKEILKDFWQAYRVFEDLPVNRDGMGHLAAYGWDV